jgi:hypothetical protein
MKLNTEGDITFDAIEFLDFAHFRDLMDPSVVVEGVGPYGSTAEFERARNAKVLNALSIKSVGQSRIKVQYCANKSREESRLSSRTLCRRPTWDTWRINKATRLIAMARVGLPHYFAHT